MKLEEKVSYPFIRYGWKFFNQPTDKSFNKHECPLSMQKACFFQKFLFKINILCKLTAQPPKSKVLRNDKVFESLMPGFSCANSDKMRITIFFQHQLLSIPTCFIIKFKSILYYCTSF